MARARAERLGGEASAPGRASRSRTETFPLQSGASEIGLPGPPPVQEPAAVLQEGSFHDRKASPISIESAEDAIGPKAHAAR